MPRSMPRACTLQMCTPCSQHSAAVAPALTPASDARRWGGERSFSSLAVLLGARQQGQTVPAKGGPEGPRERDSAAGSTAQLTPCVGGTFGSTSSICSSCRWRKPSKRASSDRRVTTRRQECVTMTAMPCRPSMRAVVGAPLRLTGVITRQLQQSAAAMIAPTTRSAMEGCYLATEACSCHGGTGLLNSS